MERITDTLVNWASILEPSTKSQACETAKMPFIYPHLALMPDAHLGKGATVGSVIPTDGAIMPAAVGVDIGCGMMAVQTQWTRQDIQDVQLGNQGDMHRSLSELHAAISKAVPLSAGAANGRITKTAQARIERLEKLAGIKQAEVALPGWRMQLGTLGSGNHFIEVSLDEDDVVWLFLHSGSRGVGNKLAAKHIKVAQQLCQEANVKLVDRDLAFLTEGTPEFDEYIEALRWAQTFALLNREEMMDRVIQCMSDFMGEPVRVQETVSCHHNYTEREIHFGREVWLSRKGAISAKVGQLGLIPGSMGDRSYVVSGKGNVDALNSAPHGAGRNHSRSAAKRLFTRDDLDSRMAGVAWGESDAFLDEHPNAYKPIDVVMRDADDLVEIVHELRQIVNVKGN
jgi:tRNA-splicing ligase RtcB